MVNILRFHGNLQSHMKQHKPMIKLLAFKMIVGLEFLEQVSYIYPFNPCYSTSGESLTHIR